MDIPETYFAIMYRVIRRQNEILLNEIAIRENLPRNVLMKTFLPSRTELKRFMSRKNHPPHPHHLPPPDHPREQTSALPPCPCS